jgi:hypothetical protein
MLCVQFVQLRNACLNVTGISSMTKCRKSVENVFQHVRVVVQIQIIARDVWIKVVKCVRILLYVSSVMRQWAEVRLHANVQRRRSMTFQVTHVLHVTMIALAVRMAQTTLVLLATMDCFCSQTLSIAFQPVRRTTTPAPEFVWLTCSLIQAALSMTQLKLT